MAHPSPAGAPVSLLLADDHTIVRTGLQMLMQVECGLSRFHEAASCEETMTQLRRHSPTHLLTDMVFRDGNALEILPSVRSLFPDMQIMVYSMLPADVYAPALQRIGIRRYLHKGCGQEETLAGLCSFISSVADARTAEAPSDESSPFGQLSPRELEVLHYLLRGTSTGAIASALNLHKSSISTMKSRIYEKLNVASYPALLELATLYNLKS